MTVTSQPDQHSSAGAPDLAQLLRPVVRESSVSEVAKRLLDHLSAGDIRPGTRLPAERQLAEALGVARSSVRGALSALDVLGIIEIRPGSGSYVREGTSEFLPRAINWGLMLGQRRTQDLVEVRTYMEGVSARLAAERATDADVARLEEHLQHMRDAGGDVTAFIDADIAFHLETARIARNTVLSDILHSIRALLQVWMERVSDIEGTVSGTLCEHDAVLQAVRARDPEAADRAMAEHMRMASARLRASVDGTGDGEG
ncbi:MULTISPECIES: FadR/GntR family transcriptional regulator [Streptomyces]|uniref:FadR family transcriptional regulator n=1 Tax=Streptomyces tendae TaxID=1932 RepID=A0A6B3QD85_STRTE|nr:MULTISPECIES: FadR/GntR family transcriptional regulator [unclassified Streptomyces]MBQ0964291.1 FadR family transcriptional regulator [Streptomyces sp. RK74B]MBQ1003503.1 FadR family transcriptional regulator [Streptomyces sp. RK23]NEV86153.1 FadR family transcriptional regulator [Streptomyces tendae]BET45587.1 FadR/GntR family transcriptional regulator [Kitasatospora aureofaciens]